MKLCQGLVSICIATYNRQEDLIQVLKALEGQSFNRFEVVIIEGGDVGRTKEVLERYRKVTSPIRLYKQEQEGLVNARNQAWRKAKGDICVFVDDDVIPTPSWLAQIENSYHEFGEQVGGVGGPSIIPQHLIGKRDLSRYLFEPNSSFARIVRTIYFLSFLESKPYQLNKVYRSGAFSLGSMTPKAVDKLSNRIIEVDYLDASNMSFRRRVLDEIGGFDDSFKGVGDFSEPDLCFRIRRLKLSLLFNPNATVYHHVSRNGVYAKRTSLSGAMARLRNLSLFIHRHIRVNSRSLLYQSFVALYLVYSALRSRR